MDQYELKEKMGQNLYYILVGVVSLILLCFLPFLGTELGFELELPDTISGWIVFSISKLSVAICNMLIFHCFIKQARLNIKTDENYQTARLAYNDGVLDDKRYKPKSPKHFMRGEYSKKGTTVFLSSLVGVIALTQAILSFNLVVFLTTVFTLVMGIIFGVLEMRTVEIYWTEEFVNYVKLNFGEKYDKYAQKESAPAPSNENMTSAQTNQEQKQEEITNDSNREQTVSQPLGTSTEEQAGH